MAPDQTYFVLAASNLFWFCVHLNSTSLKGDTAPLFLNSWGFWENSEPSGLDRSHLELLQGWIWMKWRSLDNIWSSDWIIGGSLNYKITKSQITNSPWLRSRRIANHKVPFLCWPWIISNTKSITNTNHKDFHPRLRIFKSQMPILHWRCLEHILGTGCDGGKSSRNNNWDCRTYRWDWEENNFRPMIVHQQLDWVAIAGIPIIFFTFIILLRWLRNISMSSTPCRKI